MEQLIKESKVLVDAFSKAGKSLFLVGGSIRDFYLGLKVKDLDYATNALPEETEEILESIGLITFPLGERFGSIATIWGDKQVEITTFRSEKYSGGSRKPEVAFSKDILIDLSRRDFAVGAIAYDLINNKLVDPYNGMDDIKNLRLKTPINSEITFSDDPLRMLRAARFQARGFIPSDEISKATIKLKDRIKIVSKERISYELDRILTEPDGLLVAKALKWLADTGLLGEIFPELVKTYNMPQNEYHFKDVWNHTLLAVSKTSSNSILRWATLFHDIGKPDTYKVIKGGVHFYKHHTVGGKIWDNISKRLNLSNSFSKDVGFLISNHLRPSNIYGRSLIPPTDKAVRRLYFDCLEQGPDIYDLLLDLSKADCSSGKIEEPERVGMQVEYLRARPKIIFNGEAKEPKLPTGLGTALIDKFNRDPGPWLRDIQDYLLKKVVDGDISLQPTIEECLKWTGENYIEPQK